MERFELICDKVLVEYPQGIPTLPPRIPDFDVLPEIPTPSGDPHALGGPPEDPRLRCRSGDPHGSRDPDRRFEAEEKDAKCRVNTEAYQRPIKRYELTNLANEQSTTLIVYVGDGE